MSQDSVQVVRGVYEAFGRGDVPGALALRAPDISREVVGQPGGYPRWRAFEGADGKVASFREFSDTAQVAAAYQA